MTMTPEQAIDVMARVIIEHGMEQALEDGTVLWEDYPEIGEHDWNAIAERVRATLPRVPERFIAEAHDLLKARAEPDGAVGS